VKVLGISTDTFLPQSHNLQVALLASVCAVVYAPALNNGFIADDYPFLALADQFRTDFFVLFRVPPLNFRMTTFIVFEVLQSAFGYRPEAFYAFNILLHFVNCLLLWKLVVLMDGPPTAGYLASMLFAVFHAPQEAVMWPAAMGEALQGLLILITLVLWLRRRYWLSLLCYCVALFTKESAPIVLVLLAIIQWQRKEPVFSKAYGVFWIPTVAFGGLFLGLWSNNGFIQQRVYAFSPHALSVLVKSFHRLIWPWLYVLVVAFRLSTGMWMDAAMVKCLGLISIAMAPYIFLTYASAVPSRHLYLASMVVAATMAYALQRLTSVTLRRAFVCVFILYNVGYLWIRKDAQFEERAAPTTALLEVLRTRPPTPIMIVGFPYPYPEIAKAVSRFAPGWTPDLIGVEGTGEPCAQCVKLRWDPRARRYLEN
jgi:hypothetical protein